jgi:hypothetical protein
MVNIIMPFMPITSDGKSPDFSLLNDVIDKTMREATRKFKASSGHLHYRKKSQRDIIIGNLDSAISKVSGNGEYRYSLRQLYYAIRPNVIDESGKDLTYDNFNKVISDHENTIKSDLPKIYRDSRGTLYHPHLHEVMELGTISVEKYKYPQFLFNKIIYIEKEGFFEILKNAQWPEKHDCALLTSKGYASRAAKDIIDLLGEADEEIQFFCVHDADAAGTMIYQTLVNATRARQKRKVSVINLGLEADEGKRLNLQVEKIPNSKRSPVADYVDSFWEMWLQKNRIELNAMDSPQFIEWLDNKMKEHGKGKIIPPENVLKEKLSTYAIENIEQNLITKILKDAKYDKQRENELRINSRLIVKLSQNLILKLTNVQKQNPTSYWPDFLKKVAETLLKDDINNKNNENNGG